MLNRLREKVYLTFCVEELSARHDATRTGERPPVIGMCGGTVLPELGYIFRPAVWGRGYATEALKGFLNWYWDTFPDGHPALQGEDKNYLKAVTGPRSDSASSIAVLRKCGFEYWKEQEEDDNLGPGKVMLLVWRRWKPGMQLL